MKVIVEANIPYVRGILERYFDVEYLAAKDFTPSAVKDADALMVRTRTKCNESLLAGSKVRFIGTATIGTDHIDKEYCKRAGIGVFSAPGCNAAGVAQYVIACIGNWMQKEELTLEQPELLTIGIVGAGHVGSIIERWAHQIGFKVLVNDPPRKRSENASKFVDLETIEKEADIITFHVPLNRDGADKTYHICNTAFIDNLSHCKLLINSARGEIVDTQALLEGIENGKIGDVAIDCWESEPNINPNLLATAFVATPHIAGYSAEGKYRATTMILEDLAQFFHLDIPITKEPKPATGAKDVTLKKVMQSYNPLDDTQNLKKSPEKFEEFRNHYNLRSEVE